MADKVRFKNGVDLPPRRPFARDGPSTQANPPQDIVPLGIAAVLRLVPAGSSKSAAREALVYMMQVRREIVGRSQTAKARQR